MGLNLEGISAIIITYNEEENIRDCLESIKWVDEIIIVDSFSKDKTVFICKEYTEKIIRKRWEGCGLQKQYALNEATLEWVLSIDADERISRELKEEILSSDLKKDAYLIPRRFYWLGKELRFVRRERRIRLFRRKKAMFSKDPIHEKVIVKGEIGSLKNPILHFSYKDIGDYFDRFNFYTTLSAEEKFKEKKNPLFLLQIIISFLDFFYRYILKLGFLDGIHGFLWAIFSSFYRIVKYAKLWEKYENIDHKE